MDVRIGVPKSATLKIDDSSGDMEVADVQAATINDSSGDQTLENVAGDLDVTDSSGEIKIIKVGGGLRLSDSSGDVDVDGVQGDVMVEVDSSGDLDIRHVSGGVHVRNDSSGDIESPARCTCPTDRVPTEVSGRARPAGDRSSRRPSAGNRRRTD
jgi:DUF4097 and DUF4098 domain-containing protein YvlB